MKSIGIVTDHNSELAKVMKENLALVFHDYVKINNYYFNTLEEKEKIKDDVILVMVKERVFQIKKNVQDVKNVVIIHRTIYEKEVYKLFYIPEKMDILVVNDTQETTLETISMFYQLGINHLNFIPYNQNNENIKIAITPGERKRVPANIHEIIDVGHRCIDISTFIEIISKLNIDNKEINKRLIQYGESIVSLDNGIKNKYKELFIKNEELDTIINLSEEGILVTTVEGDILICNKAFKKIFEIKEDLIGTNIEHVFEENMRNEIKEDLFRNKILKFKEKYINVNKHFIEHFEKRTGVYFNIQEITYIKKLEQNLSKQLKDKGQIARYTFENMKTNSHIMKNCIDLGRKIATSDLTILITGESGTGKELLAQSIHNTSNKKNQPFVAVNCAAVPENLLESELFGYEPGAFTGALKEGKKGLFEQAHNGSLFLDEIGDMPVLLQTKLLRVLQERQVMRIGSQKLIDIDVRIIAATNKNLLHEIERGNFRNDLYYRLNVLPIHIPPLRERKEDIIELINFYMEKEVSLHEEVKQVLLEYKWPGNIREIKNVASYMALMSEDIVCLENLPFYILNRNMNFEKELNLLNNQFKIEYVVEILNLIKEHKELQKSLGRNSLAKILQNKGTYIKESEVRRILAVLKELGIISSHPGRKGSELTLKGRQFINRILNR